LISKDKKKGGISSIWLVSSSSSEASYMKTGLHKWVAAAENKWY
jgi:hypothetical protein